MKRIPVAAIAILLVATPALTGCFNGRGATTTMQASMNSGNGVAAQAGEIKVENATLVLGPENANSATLTARIVNIGPVADRLVYATVNGSPADITAGGVDLEPGASISFGFDSDTWINAYALDAAVSTYVPVQLGFADAGILSMSVLTVPPTGYYAGISPNPPQSPAEPSPAAS